MSPAPALTIDNVTVHRGGTCTVDAFSCVVREGEITALLGANGAGKSTVLEAVSGLVATASGSIRAGTTTLNGLPPERRARYVAHVPEGRRLFVEHTVRENLDLAAFGRSRRERAELRHRVFELFPRLAVHADRRAGVLSGGEQQMVALGRGLMSTCPVLVVDELSLGLAPRVAKDFADTLRSLRDEGLAILLVEQYVGLALSVADAVIVMDRGKVVSSGDASALAKEPHLLRAAYLGATATE